MPIYEYRCSACRRRFSVLVGVVANTKPIECPRCGSTDAGRLMSRFARVRSEDEVLDNLADSADVGGVDENDPASVARFMKQMGGEMGEDFGDDFEQALEEEYQAESDQDSPSGNQDALSD
ncbi:MAG TPA: zinc ribbon domain-containing protein [Armatimonadota bacterium]|jgi:putative FmdB family regulatory protein